MSGATEVSKQEKHFLIQLKTVSIIFENETEEGAMIEREWHEDQEAALSSKINEYAPIIRAEIDSIIKSDNDKFGIIEYSSEIQAAPYNIDELVANANRPYKMVRDPDDNHEDANNEFNFVLMKKVYLDNTDDASVDDVLFMPEVTGPYRYTLRLSGSSGSEYVNDYFTLVTVALKLGIPSSVRKELATRLSNSIK